MAEEKDSHRPSNLVLAFVAGGAGGAGVWGAPGAGGGRRPPGGERGGRGAAAPAGGGAGGAEGVTAPLRSVEDSLTTDGDGSPLPRLDALGLVAGGAGRAHTA